MPSVVSIQIQVQDNGSLAVIGQHTQALEQLGAAGMSAGVHVDQGMQRASGHIQTNLDAVRLLSQEFGMRMPRAIEQMLSRVPAVTGALNSVIGGLAGVAGIEIFAHIGEEAYKFYENMTDVNREVSKYLEQTGKSANDKLFDNASIETTVDLLSEANRQIDQLEKKRTAAGVGEDNSGSLKQYLMKYGRMVAGGGLSNPSDIGAVDNAAPAAIFDKDDDAALAQAMANRDKAKSRYNDLGRKDDIERMQNRQQATASALTGINQIETARTNAYKVAQVERENALATERDLVKTTQDMRDAQLKAGMSLTDPTLTQVHVTDPNAGLAAMKMAEQKADEDASAKRSNFARKERDERIAAENEAVNAGIHGEAKYAAAEAQALDAVTRKYQDSELSKQGYLAITHSIETKFANERLEREKQLADEAKKMHEETDMDNMTGAQRILAERDAQIGDINQREADATGKGGTLSASQKQSFDSERADAAAAAYQKLNKLEDDYTSHVREQSQERADAVLSVSAKIDASAAREKQQLQSDFDKNFGGANLDPDKAAAAEQALADAKAGVDADARQQKQTIDARNRAEDLQYDQQAAAAEARVREQSATGMVAAHKNAMAEIQAQEEQRMAKLADDAQKEGLTWQEVAERRTDIEREASAEIAEQNEQMVHTLAGQLQSAFDNPMKFLKEKAEKAMFEIIANWMMQTQLFKGFFGSTMSGLQPGTPGGAGAGGTVGATGGSAAGMSGMLQRVFGGHGAPAGTAGVIHGGTYLPSSESSGASGGVSAGGSDTSTPITAVMGARSAYTPQQSSESYEAGGFGSSSGGSWSSTGSAGPSSSGFGSFTGGTSATPAMMFAAGPGGSTASYGGAMGGSGAAHASVAAAKPGAMSTTSSLLGAPAALAKTLGLGGKQASVASAATGGGNGYTGEDGGFAGSMTGDTSDMGAGYSDPSSMGSVANQQASGVLQSTAGGVNAGGALAGVMGMGNTALAGYQGAEGVLASFHEGGVNGALKGVESGAALGASIGSIVPGLGTVVGGAIGAVAGLTTNLVGDAMGESGRFAARDYYKKTLYPELEGVRTSFLGQGSGGDYLSAVSEANRDAASGMTYMGQKWGTDAAAYVNSNYLQKELTYVTSTIERMARGGAQYTGRAAAEFHTGGIIGGFGDLGTTSNEGYIHAMMGEGITNVPATQMHGAAIQKMNDGATPADMATHYLNATAAGSSRAPAASGSSGGDVHIHTLDTKTMTTWLRNGGAKMISSAQNAHVGSYAGSSSNG